MTPKKAKQQKIAKMCQLGIKIDVAHYDTLTRM
jgi:hypothetical protein